MKKGAARLTLALALVFLVTGINAIGNTFPPKPNAYFMGDANGDTGVTGADIVQHYNYILSKAYTYDTLQPNNSAQAWNTCDVDSNRGCTGSDTVILNSYLLSKSVSVLDNPWSVNNMDLPLGGNPLNTWIPFTIDLHSTFSAAASGRPGISVVVEIDPAFSTTTGQLSGRSCTPVAGTRDQAALTLAQCALSVSQTNWPLSTATGPTESGTYGLQVMAYGNGDLNLKVYTVATPGLDIPATSTRLNVSFSGTANQSPTVTLTCPASEQETRDIDCTFTTSDPDIPIQTVTVAVNPMTDTCGGSIIAGHYIAPTTEAQGPASCVVGVVATDDGIPPASGYDQKTVLITEVNASPTLALNCPASVGEETDIVCNMVATDPDIPPNTLTFTRHVSDTCLGTIVGSTYTATTTENQGPGSCLVVVTVADNGVPVRSVTRNSTVTITEVNKNPAVTVSCPANVGEDHSASCTLSASDADFPAQDLTCSVDPSSTCTGVTNSSCTSANVPPQGEATGPGTCTVVIAVQDNFSPAGSSLGSTSITIDEENQNPSVVVNCPANVGETSTVTCALTATDADLPAQGLTCDVDVSSTCTGATISGCTQVDVAAQGENKGPGSCSVVVNVHDSYSGTSQGSDSMTIDEDNQNPTVSVDCPVSVGETGTTTCALTAADADLPAQGLTCDLDVSSTCTGATISGCTQVDVAAQGENKGPGSCSVVVNVHDSYSGTSQGSDSITIDEDNQIPTVVVDCPVSVGETNTTSCTLTAADADLPAQGLTCAVGAGTCTGVTLTGCTSAEVPAQGELAGGASCTVVVEVTDTYSGTGSGSDSLAIDETNETPVITSTCATTATEGVLYTCDLTASDADNPAQGQTWTTTGADTCGGTITGSTYNWTPTEAQGGSGSCVVGVQVADSFTPAGTATQATTVTPAEANANPVITSICATTASEGVPYACNLTASDADIPAQTFTWTIVAGNTCGGTITGSTFNWTPSETQGGGTCLIEVQVADSFSPAGTATQPTTVTVIETNQNPVIISSCPTTATEGVPYICNLTASDADNPVQTLTWSLSVDDTCAGTITGSAYNWTPTEAQGGAGTCVVGVQVADSFSPAGTATRNTTVTPSEVNSPPVVSISCPLAIVYPGLIVCEITATDPDLPAQTFTPFVELSADTCGGTILGATYTAPTEDMFFPPEACLVSIGVIDNGLPALIGYDSAEVNINPADTVAPILSWTLETGYDADGVENNTFTGYGMDNAGLSGDSFIFRVTFTSDLISPPESVELMIDLNNDGDYAGLGEVVALTCDVDCSSNDFSAGVIFTSNLITVTRGSAAYVGAGELNYKFAATDGLGRPATTGVPVNASIVTVRHNPAELVILGKAGIEAEPTPGVTGLLAIQNLFMEAERIEDAAAPGTANNYLSYPPTYPDASYLDSKWGAVLADAMLFTKNFYVGMDWSNPAATMEEWISDQIVPVMDLNNLRIQDMKAATGFDTWEFNLNKSVRFIVNNGLPFMGAPMEIELGERNTGGVWDASEVYMTEALIRGFRGICEFAMAYGIRSVTMADAFTLVDQLEPEPDMLAYFIAELTGAPLPALNGIDDDNDGVVDDLMALGRAFSTFPELLTYTGGPTGTSLDDFRLDLIGVNEALQGAVLATTSKTTDQSRDIWLIWRDDGYDGLPGTLDTGEGDGVYGLVDNNSDGFADVAWGGYPIGFLPLGFSNAEPLEVNLHGADYDAMMTTLMDGLSAMLARFMGGTPITLPTMGEEDIVALLNDVATDMTASLEGTYSFDWSQHVLGIFDIINSVAPGLNLTCPPGLVTFFDEINVRVELERHWNFRDTFFPEYIPEFGQKGDILFGFVGDWSEQWDPIVLSAGSPALFKIEPYVDFEVDPLTGNPTGSMILGFNDIDNNGQPGIFEPFLDIDLNGQPDQYIDLNNDGSWNGWTEREHNTVPGTNGGIGYHNPLFVYFPDTFMQNTSLAGLSDDHFNKYLGLIFDFIGGIQLAPPVNETPIFTGVVFDPPIVEVSPGVGVITAESGPVTIRVSGVDADGNPLVFSLAAGHGASVVSAANVGTITWTPSSPPPGEQLTGTKVFLGTIYDGQNIIDGWTTFQFAIEVIPEAIAITCSDTLEAAGIACPIVANVGSSTCSIGGSDTCGGSVNSNCTGSYTAPPQGEDAGPGTCVAHVVKGAASSTQTVNILEDNQNPVVTLDCPANIGETVATSCAVTASDPDNAQTVSCVLGSGVGACVGATINVECTQVDVPAQGEDAGPGSCTVEVVATDSFLIPGPAGTASASDSITIDEQNQAPLVTVDCPANIGELNTSTCLVTASDPDNAQTVSCALGAGVGACVGATINAECTQVDVPAQGEDAGPGSCTVEVVATDSFSPAGNASASDSITIDEQNQNPLVTVDCPANIGETVATSCAVTASDPDNAQTVSCALGSGVGACVGATINAECTQVDVPAQGEDAGPGSCTVEVVATDSFLIPGPAGTASVSDSITIDEENQNPTVSLDCPAIIGETVATSCAVTASDPDNAQTVSCALGAGVGACVGATINAECTQVDVPAQGEDAGPGSCTVEVVATDSFSPAGTTTVSDSITITEDNQSPYFTSAAPTTATQAVPFSYSPTFDDNDLPDAVAGDPGYVSCTGISNNTCGSWMTVSGCDVSGTPDVSSGDCSYDITVTDGLGATGVQTVSLDIPDTGAPILSWTGLTGFATDGVDNEYGSAEYGLENVGLSGDTFIFSVTYTSQLILAPTSVSVGVDLNGDGDVTDPGETVPLVCDAMVSNCGDTFYQLGKVFTGSMTITRGSAAYVGAGDLNYRFSATDAFGRVATTGDPVSNAVVTVRHNPTELVALGKAALDNVETAGLPGLRVALNLFEESEGIEDELADGTLNNYPSYPSPEYPDGNVLDTKFGAMISEMLIYMRHTDEFDWSTPNNMDEFVRNEWEPVIDRNLDRVAAMKEDAAFDTTWEFRLNNQLPVILWEGETFLGSVLDFRPGPGDWDASEVYMAEALLLGCRGIGEFFLAYGASGVSVDYFLTDFQRAIAVEPDALAYWMSAITGETSPLNHLDDDGDGLVDDIGAIGRILSQNPLLLSYTGDPAGTEITAARLDLAAMIISLQKAVQSVTFETDDQSDDIFLRYRDDGLDKTPGTIDTGEGNGQYDLVDANGDRFVDPNYGSNPGNFIPLSFSDGEPLEIRDMDVAYHDAMHSLSTGLGDLLARLLGGASPITLPEYEEEELIGWIKYVSVGVEHSLTGEEGMNAAPMVQFLFDTVNSIIPPEIGQFDPPAFLMDLVDDIDFRWLADQHYSIRDRILPAVYPESAQEGLLFAFVIGWDEPFDPVVIEPDGLGAMYKVEPSMAPEIDPTTGNPTGDYVLGFNDTDSDGLPDILETFIPDVDGAPIHYLDLNNDGKWNGWTDTEYNAVDTTHGGIGYYNPVFIYLPPPFGVPDPDELNQYVSLIWSFAWGVHFIPQANITPEVVGNPTFNAPLVVPDPGNPTVAAVLADAGEVTINVTATDADGDPLVFAMPVGHGGTITTSGNTGTVTWDPMADIPVGEQLLGPKTFVVTAYDGKNVINGWTGIVFTIVVMPSVAINCPSPVDELTPVSCGVTATGGAPSVLAGTDTCGGVINGSGPWTYDFTPTESQGPDDCLAAVIVGTAPYQTPAADAVVINEVNQNPSITVNCPANVGETNTSSCSLTAADADLPAQGLSCTTIGSTCTGLTLHDCSQVDVAAQGELAGGGSCTVVVNISDGLGGSDSDSGSITIDETNETPAITSTCATTASEGAAYSCSLTATDADDPVQTSTWTLSGDTCGGAITGSTYNWTPSETQGGGNCTVGVQVADSFAPAGTATQSTTVTVTETNQNPYFTSAAPTTATQAVPFSYSPTFDDNDLPDAVAGDPGYVSCTGISNNTCGSWMTVSGCDVSGTPDVSSGDCSYDITVTDGLGATGVQTVSLDIPDTGAPILSWTGLTGFATDGVDNEYGSAEYGLENVGLSGDTFIFSVTYTSQLILAPTSVSVGVDLNGDGDVTDPGETVPLVCDAMVSNCGDTFYQLGKVFTGSMTITRGSEAYVGAGDLNYRFSATDAFGRVATTGDPVSNAVVTVRHNPTELVALGKAALDNVETAGLPGLRVALNLFEESEGIEDELADGTLNNYPSYPSPEYPDGNVLDTKFGAMVSEILIYARNTDEYSWAYSNMDEWIAAEWQPLIDRNLDRIAAMKEDAAFDTTWEFRLNNQLPVVLFEGRTIYGNALEFMPGPGDWDASEVYMAEALLLGCRGLGNFFLAYGASGVSVTGFLNDFAVAIYPEYDAFNFLMSAISGVNNPALLNGIDDDGDGVPDDLVAIGRLLSTYPALLSYTGDPAGTEITAARLDFAATIIALQNAVRSVTFETDDQSDDIFLRYRDDGLDKTPGTIDTGEGNGQYDLVDADGDRFVDPNYGSNPSNFIPLSFSDGEPLEIRDMDVAYHDAMHSLSTGLGDLLARLLGGASPITLPEYEEEELIGWIKYVSVGVEHSLTGEEGMNAAPMVQFLFDTVNSIIPPEIGQFDPPVSLMNAVDDIDFKWLADQHLSIRDHFLPAVYPQDEQRGLLMAFVADWDELFDPAVLEPDGLGAMYKVEPSMAPEIDPTTGNPTGDYVLGFNDTDSDGLPDILETFIPDGDGVPIHYLDLNNDGEWNGWRDLPYNSVPGTNGGIGFYNSIYIYLPPDFGYADVNPNLENTNKYLSLLWSLATGVHFIPQANITPEVVGNPTFNAPLVVPDPGNPTVAAVLADAGEVTINVTATDADGDPLVFAMPVGHGGTITTSGNTGTVTWDPMADIPVGEQLLGPKTFVVTAYDGKNVINGWTGIVFTIVVMPSVAINCPSPVDELTPVSCGVTATGGVPSVVGGVGTCGGVINGSGPWTYDFTPTESQGPGSCLAAVIVGTAPYQTPASDTVVINEVNQDPSITVNCPANVGETNTSSCSLTATDADLPDQLLSCNTTGSTCTGLTLNGCTQVDVAAQGELEGGGSCTVVVNVTDTYSGTGSDSGSITIDETNETPVITSTCATTASEGAAYSCSLTATDADDPVQTLTWTLSGDTCGGAITGSTYNWTPSETQGGGNCTIGVQVADNFPVTPGTATQSTTVTVTETNVNPVITSTCGTAASEGAAYSCNLTATDADLPGQTLTWSLSGDDCGGAITGSTYNWTPSETQGGGNCAVGVQVADDFAPAGTNTYSVSVAVTETNDDPVITSTCATTASEGTPYTCNLTSTDADIPAQSLTLSLSSDTCGGTITDNGDGTGTYNWTPDESQGGVIPCVVGVQVADNFPVTPGTDTQTTTVTVTETNVNPVLTMSQTSISVQVYGSVNEEVGSATDTDDPAQTLTCAVVSNTCFFPVNPGGESTSPVTCSVVFDAPASTATCSVNIQVTDGATGASNIGTVNIEIVPCVFRVSSNGNDGNGATWDTAIWDLQMAVDAADANPATDCQVWVDGNDSFSSPDGIDPAVAMAEDVDLYGSFDGEDDPGDRTFSSSTYLYGDGSADHVVVGASNARLDGFYVYGNYYNTYSPGAGMINDNITNLTVENCDFAGFDVTISDSGTLDGGAAMANSNSNNIQMINCSFNWNYLIIDDATNSLGGAAISNRNSTNILIDNSIFVFNETDVADESIAQGGGAIYNNNTTVTISNSRFGPLDPYDFGPNMVYFDIDPAVGVQAAGGGAIYNYASPATISNSKFNTNYVSYGDSAQAVGGGAIYNMSSPSVTTDCTFQLNYTAYSAGLTPVASLNSGGGTIYNYGSSPSILNSLFYGSGADDPTGGGGAIYNNSTLYTGSTLTTIKNNLFLSNRANVGGNGGAIYNNNLTPIGNGVLIINSTFSENWGTGQGGAIFNSSASPYIRNCILWGDVEDATGSTSNEIRNGLASRVSYSDVGQAGFSLVSPNFNINSDPLWFDPLPLGSEFGYLLEQIAPESLSPCVNAGNPADASPGGTTASNGDPDTGIVDMGYHYIP